MAAWFFLLSEWSKFYNDLLAGEFCSREAGSFPQLTSPVLGPLPREFSQQQGDYAPLTASLGGGWPVRTQSLKLLGRICLVSTLDRG